MQFDEIDGSRRDRYEALAQEWMVPFVDLAIYRPDKPAIDSLTAAIAHRYRVIPIKKEATELFAAFADINDLEAQDVVRLHSHCLVRPVMAVPEVIDAAIKRFYPDEEKP
jgi:type IV pilus assembly protein PilB